MDSTLVPCNSFAEPETDVLPSFYSSGLGTFSSVTRSARRSKISISDFEIIQECMSLERKKTLMCTEQSNFKILHKFRVPSTPKKKFKARAPSEYNKYILKLNNFAENKSNEVKYKYPLSEPSTNESACIIQSNQEFNEINKKQKVSQKGKSSVCAIF
jgi:hypothetical protein